MPFKIDWIDREREPQCPPDPRFPNGIDVDVSAGRLSCETALPYPAPRCGMFYVECQVCGANAMITTAGRLDDPRSARLPCNRGA